MKRVVALLTILSLLLAGLSVAVQAANLRETDPNVPEWGFDFKVGIDDDGGFLSGESKYSAWWRIKTTDPYRWQKKITGAYTKPGPDVITLVGAKLGATYSPYGAWFKTDLDDVHVRGVRVMRYPVNIAGNEFTFDGVFVVPGSKDQHNHTGYKDPGYDLGLDVKGKVGIVNLHIALARDMIQTKTEQDDGVRAFESYYAYILEPTLNVTKDIKIMSLYAGYTKNKTSLWKVDAEWKVVGDSLKVRAGVRDSDAGFEPKYTDKTDGDGNTNVMFDQRQKGEGFSVGTTVKFQPIADMTMTFDADYDSRVDRDIDEDGIELGLKTRYKGYSADQTLSFPKVRVKSGQADTRLYDLGYTLRAKTPTYDLPFDVKLYAGFDNDTDIDAKYLENMWNRLYARADKQMDLPYFPRVKTSCVVLYEDEIKAGQEVSFLNPLKAAVQAEYTAPNGVKFTIQYLTSNDYNNRLSDYKYYDDDRGGFRLQITFARSW